MSQRLDRLARHLRGGVTPDHYSSSPSKEPDPIIVCDDGTSRRTMDSERARAGFETRAMTFWIDGSPKKTACREQAMREIEKYPIMLTDEDIDCDQAERRRRTMARVRQSFRLFFHESSGVELRKARMEIFGLADASWETRFGVHYGLFLGAIRSQGTPDQQAAIMPDALTLRLYGCFALTEMGHGSHARGVETEATFVPGGGKDGDGEFVLRTPTVTATKWWIGGAAHTATHASVFSRLIVGGVDHGVHVFFVRLRQEDSHRPLPGIVIGDIGAKYGRHGIDNGWIQFHNHRLPRSALLSRHIQVARDGTVTRPERSARALTFGALLLARAGVAQQSADTLKLAVTVAVRYGAVRRQGPPFEKGGREPQILDYATHQRRLLLPLARAFALQAAAHDVIDLHERFQASQSHGDFSLLPAIHATSAALKAFGAWMTLRDVEDLRQSCGGHGYSAYNRLSGLVADFSVQCTWDGDNTVLALQTARALLTARLKHRARHAHTRGRDEREGEGGEEGDDPMAYLRSPSPPPLPPSPRADSGLVAFWLAALRARAWFRVETAARALRDACEEHGGARRGRGGGGEEGEGDVQPSDAPAAAWSAVSPVLVAAAEAHVALSMGLALERRVRARLQEEDADVRRREEGLGPVLLQILELFLVASLAGAAETDLWRMRWWSEAEARRREERETALLRSLRPNAVALVDSFNFSDALIGAPIGRYDGNVYEAYMKRVLSAPRAMGPADYEDELIRPLLRGDDLQPPHAGAGEET